jgi:gliding motility-associated-like protein
MYNKKFLLLAFFILLSLNSFSAVFVVTSNADSGPGTLRDALTQAAANGVAEKDYINFNLMDVSEAGRTITINSQLPDVTGNVIIDGTTQPGVSFGVTNTKIKITTNAVFLVQIININNGSDIEIYGLNIIGTWSEQNINSECNGINIINSSAITIGAKGKGNLFNNCFYSISTASSNNLAIQCNIAGLKPDGLTSDKNYKAISCSNSTGITVGGSPDLRNILSDDGQDEIDLSGGSGFNIDNNFFGTNYTGNGVTGSTFIGTAYSAYGVSGTGSDNLTITNNVFAGLGSAVILFNISSHYVIENNKFGIGFTGNANFGNRDAIVIFNSKGKGLVDHNIIAYNENAVAINASNSVTISKNSFYCNVNDPIQFISSPVAIPTINITARSGGQIAGSASKNAKIELFYTDECQLCQGKTYISTVMSDANGLWSYTGTINGTIVGTATDANGTTSAFSVPQVVADNVVVKNVTCDNNGSITGIKPINSTDSYWTDQNGLIVSHSTDLLNAVSGTYTLHVDNGSCSATSQTYTILDYSIKIDGSKVKIINPACGNANGSILGTNLFDGEPGKNSIYWKDANGKIWGENSNLENVPAGTYYFFASNSDISCTQMYGPVTLTNTTGPKIDQSQQQIQSTDCGQSTGAITNIKVSDGTGNYQYSWVDAQKNPVGTDKDLTGQPAGIYTLKVTDGGSCGPLYSTAITIPEINGITLDESKATPTPATCGLSNGTITGITVTGATQYIWTDANGKTYTTPTPDLTNAPAGSYTLTVSNATNCSKTSGSYTILQPAATQYPAFSYTSHSTCKNASVGSITITISKDNLVKSLRWVNSAGQNIGYNNEVDNLPEGTYKLYFTDYSGCETLYNSYNITAIPPLTIVAGSEQKHNDQCETSTGSITGIEVEGGLTPYTYSWTNANGSIVSQTADLANAQAGDYTLMVTDASGCGPVTANYTIQNNDENISAPVVSDVKLCSPGAALLKVTDPSASYSYRLYNSATEPSPIDEQKSGVFKITADANSDYYVSRFVGDCESTRTKVNISIGITGLSIANTFTPNGDGINDYWQIKNIDNYPAALIQIFNRYGQKLFESKGYGVPFDGTYKGQKLSSGVYYYIINLGIQCNLLSGSLTIIR